MVDVGAFYDKHVDEVFEFVLPLVGSRPAAEDATVETISRALREVMAVGFPAGDLDEWLTTIARQVIDSKPVARRRHTQTRR